MTKAKLTTNTTADAIPAVRSFEDWTVEELESLPSRKWNEDIGEFDSLIIMPTKNLHESEFMCMDFVAVRGIEPFCRLSGCSDVIHIGCGEWKIDCLRESKLLRLFSDGKLKAGEALSSFNLSSV